MWRQVNTVIFSALVWVNPVWADSLEDIVNAPFREASAHRDEYRHPVETLNFFEVKPNMTVVEIWPGGKGWYTEILAPYLRDNGKLYSAHFDSESSPGFYVKARAAFMESLKAQPELYRNVVMTDFDPPSKVDIAPAGTADRVLTFRNVHNWYMRGGGDERVLAAFKAFYTALKPGGILGVVDHRLPASRDLADQESSGYMRQDYVIKLAERAGFKLVASSEINANPADTADYPKGVWTLPPTLAKKEQDKNKYLAIGESDRMTLKFVKPLSE